MKILFLILCFILLGTCGTTDFCKDQIMDQWQASYDIL